MRTETDRIISTYLVFFWIPILFIARGQWDLAIIGVIIFFSAYFLLPKIKLLRREVRHLDTFVLLSYSMFLVGSLLFDLYDYDTSNSAWFCIVVVIFGYPFFKKIESYLKRDLRES